MTGFDLEAGKLRRTLGLSVDRELELRGKLEEGRDWKRHGRWVRYSPDGARRLLAVAEGGGEEARQEPLPPDVEERERPRGTLGPTGEVVEFEVVSRPGPGFDRRHFPNPYLVRAKRVAGSEKTAQDDLPHPGSLVLIRTRHSGQLMRGARVLARESGGVWWAVKVIRRAARQESRPPEAAGE